jgi:archaellum component FlaC
MDSVPGQTFLNYAYSWGASIVILGTLFKLTHLPGANFFLFLGMGTEVFVFFISAFDRPFDKTTDGMDLDLHVAEEGLSGVVVNGESNLVQGGPTVIGGEGGSTVIGGEGGGSAIIGGGGGTIVIGGSGGVVSPTASDAQSDEDGLSVRQAQTEGPVVVGGGGGIIGGGAMVAPQQPETLPMGEELKEATSNYIDELNRLTEMLTQVSEQSKRLTRDSEEMENLNRTLTGISRVYEMQLKSASSQIATIDEINEQTRRMAEQIQELNKIYARMIEAMQIRSQM